ncbi:MULTISPECIES: DUF6285 domain-containing protein [unclassified Variovorax]|uniref:DUF6285 domain-containing protein n=1 Tax=unclassified Variovorax TaxID=663243 RepID=UPI0008B97C3B|nr:MULTISPECIES: DUF6285 domain-containing protein [unclassified Variovorax]SEK09959.1 hypothetical protein SAMN05518853_10990 [Variovorax sp. OK202]SFD65652.1 hypothetical protein SAMN05444746_10990 [Variovorax sp. OK212]
MPTSVPPAATLLQAAARYLEEELLPTLDGYHRFQARVTVNVLRIVERELRSAAPPNGAGAADLALAEAIRSGRLPIDSPGLAAQLRADLAQALALNNPKWTNPESPAP